jgi:hypothetical protein
VLPFCVFCLLHTKGEEINLAGIDLGGKRGGGEGVPNGKGGTSSEEDKRKVGGSDPD